MLWTNNVVFLLIGVIVLKIIAPELNLNFQQDDYQLKFEHAGMERYNEKFLKEAHIKTFKYNRSIAVFNITITPNVDLGNDLQAIVQAYKFMSNEYRFFPLHFGANSCKIITANVIGLKSAMERCGNFTGCPWRKGIKYFGCNFYPDQSKLPPYMPNGQYKVAFQMLHSSQEIALINMYGTIYRPIV